MLRKRRFEEENYQAIFNDGITLRFAIDPSKPILPLRYPEIEDVAINSKCFANCNYCYVSALKSGINFDNIVEKIQDHYGNLILNERPFQIALGGAGEPTLHPDFPEVLKTMHELQIMPNYTTNAMHLSKKVVDATKLYSGGVAISCHPHLEKIWRKGIDTLTNAGIKTCLHIILGEPGSNDNFWKIYSTTKNIHYYVVLPYMAVGRAKQIDVEKEWDLFFEEALIRKPNDISFGALFYDYFLKNREIMNKINLSIYEPEVLSGYRIMDNSYKLLRKSSYDLSPKFTDGSQLDFNT